jgi:hypothetical protein
MTSERQYETIELQGLSFEVPRDWQIVRHGLAERKGGLTFTDRFEERMSLHWRTLDREPDISRMLQAEWAKSKGATDEMACQEFSLHDFRVFRFDDVRGSWLRAVRYDSSSRRLIEVALALQGAHARSRPVDEHMLSRIELKGTDVGSRFLAFDLDVTYPANFVVTKCEVVPVSTTLQLEARVPSNRFGTVDTISIRRMGMADTWYRGNAAALLARENPAADPRRVEARETNGHSGAGLEVRVGKPIQRWLGQGRSLRATLWHCDEENAVYHVATCSRDLRSAALEVLETRCCKWSGGSVSRGDE